MMLNDTQFVAVDVSKAMLDIALPDQIWRTPNTLSGITAPQKRLKRFEHPNVVCEVTGHYGRLLSRELSEAGIALSIVNARQVRDFARAAGQLVKMLAMEKQRLWTCNGRLIASLSRVFLA